MNKGREQHGLSRTSEYKAWNKMIDRCTNPSSKSYVNYGGRGICVCDKWLTSFSAFINDIGRKPTPLHTLERKNNNGNYEPKNCKWATRDEQNKNTRFNVILEINGQRKCVSEWSRISGMSISGLRKRLASGMSPKEAITKKKDNTKIRKQKFATINGSRKTLREWSVVFGVNKNTLYTRINRGWNILDALQTKSFPTPKQFIKPSKC